MTTAATSGNHLAGQISPYLLQHAANPVHWHPWSEAAFAEARRSGKPVLLSIGYSACHWCHVMAHESFEDPDTAQLMNRLFVNVKVDREERPDIDRIYQLAHQLLTRQGGGWPLTMFLTPDQRPFFGGTYFPREAHAGMPAFRALLERVAAYYHGQQAQLHQQGEALVDALARIDAATPADIPSLDGAPLAALREELARQFDRLQGGFGPAPKFPQPGIITRLLRDWRASAHGEQPDLQALFMATLTLKRMADGGIQDHLGGGFARYSVDERWEIPHFEKMLCDNAQLLSVYAGAALATGEPAFARVAEDIAGYLLRDCRLPGGAFCAAFDADSQGHEGRFYTWDRAEVQAALGAEEARLFCARFGLDRPANFDGRWQLIAAREIDDLARSGEFGAAEPAQLASRLDRSRALLLALRARRPWPQRDDKVLTGWNALAIKGLAEAARSLGRDDYAETALQALDYLRAHHWRDGQLLACSRGGTAHLPAYLDDYAFLLDAILAALAVHFRAADLHWATQLADALLARFEDRDAGGFFFTAHDHETLIHRSRGFDDGATPSGNAIAVRALLRLGYLLGEQRYLAAAERALCSGWNLLRSQPLAHVHLATALEQYLAAPTIVVLRGGHDALQLWRRELQRLYAPDLVVIAIAADAQQLPPALAAKPPHQAPIAYLCRGTTCEAPLSSLAELTQALQRGA
ncbi:MAG: thioredoxin domain-containing protein [Steroidobacteraceae bacterium]